MQTHVQKDKGKVFFLRLCGQVTVTSDDKIETSNLNTNFLNDDEYLSVLHAIPVLLIFNSSARTTTSNESSCCKQRTSKTTFCVSTIDNDSQNAVRTSVSSALVVSRNSDGMTFSRDNPKNNIMIRFINIKKLTGYIPCSSCLHPSISMQDI